MGMFDDLIPSNNGTFNDLVPKKESSQPVPEQPFDFSAKKMAKNFPSSALEAGKNVVSAITHPTETIPQIVHIIKGAGAKVMGLPTTPEYEGLKKRFEDRYGTVEELTKGDFTKAKMTLQKDPAGTLMDLSMIFDAVGNLPKMGALKTAAEITNPVTAGVKVAGAIAKPIAETAATGAERLSGLTYRTPGVLKEAYKDPSLIFSKGLDSARQGYEEAKQSTQNGVNYAGVEPIREDFKTTTSKDELIKKAYEEAKGGTLTTEEALEARHTLDSMKNSVPAMTFRYLRSVFDDIAKKDFEKADVGFQRAVKGEALREMMPLNKTGTPSIGKIILGGVATPSAPFLSPAIQGAAATVAGAASKVLSPVVNSPIITALLKKLEEKRKKK